MPRPPFADLSPTPAHHFRLYLYAAVLRLIARVSELEGSAEAAFERFPFLIGYNNEMAARGVDGLAAADADAWWCRELLAWEATTAEHLPLRALRTAGGLTHESMTLLLTVALIDEDVRFGPLCEALQGIPGQHRPTAALLQVLDRSDALAALRRLQQLGLIEAANPLLARSEQALQIPLNLLAILRGEAETSLASWAAHRPRAELLPMADLILDEEMRGSLASMPALLVSGEARALVLRGPRHNGRRTVLGAVARALGRGVLEVEGLAKVDDPRWSLVGPLATALHALPVLVLDLAAGETAEIPRLAGYDGPLGIALGLHGGLSGAAMERALFATLPVPDAAARQVHWRRALASRPAAEIQAIGQHRRLTAGNIRRAARLAESQAALAGRVAVTATDVQRAMRSLNRQVLDTLAVPIEASGDWSQLAVSAETGRELAILESRCRHRERLAQAVGPALGRQLNAGVRALFSGPSGTGKTLAARLLASALGMDLYRVDLSTVVNKYIGETEKNLDRVFSRAEELDVILLLDEGDALLTQRTSVQSSNDRYANLETNYLLQRLETFEGILVVTTNAGDRIDGAFQRRIDVVIDFRPPSPAERWAIWQLHLPEKHEIAPALLSDVATRCTLSGGEIRNAVLHASLLALDSGGTLTSEHFEAAIHREYRKGGAVCPLRSNGTAPAPH
jgi:SpoVK/Ycf46/Vps4 family AAA+-type ATPase